MKPDKAPAASLPPAVRKVRIGRLDSLGGVRREMSRVYREARRGEIAPSAGAKLTFMLQGISRVLEFEVIEARIAKLEERAGA